MPEAWEPNCAALAIGSLPHLDAAPALSLYLAATPELVGWPQLPAASQLENMYAQFAAGFPGLVVTGDGAHCDRDSESFDADLERLYEAHIAWDLAGRDHRGSGTDPLNAAVTSVVASIGPEYARGLHALLSLAPELIPLQAALKGQVTGPVSFGLAVTDQDQRPILYDETLGQAAALLLGLKAAWQERRLAALGRPVVLFMDEPYMATFGSAFFNYGPALVRELHQTVTQSLTATTGVHCCGNTDWTLLLGGPVRIISFDAYSYAQSMALYPQEVHQHLTRGGCLAWGIVPALPQDLAEETLDSLLVRFDAAVGLLTTKGIDRDLIMRRALITPSCGLRSQSEAGAARALRLCSQMTAALRGAPEEKEAPSHE
jgi:hypothetical protein